MESTSPKRILIWHGYLLRGSGSNIYVNNLARALCAQGHNVTVVCQDPFAGSMDFVDRFVGVRAGTDETINRGNPGTCTVIQPDIGDLLAVYVHDDYDGFAQVKTLASMSDDEVESYVSNNVAALRTIVAEQQPEIIFTNHAVCSPVIVKRADLGVPYYSYIHGSALEYAVKRDQRFFDLAVEGLSGAQNILVGSHYLQAELERLFADSELDVHDKLRLMPCGVDVDIFRLDADKQEAKQHLSDSLSTFDPGNALKPELMNKLESHVAGRSRDVLESCIADAQTHYDYTLPEAPFIEQGIAFNPTLRDDDTVNIYFLGKLIPQKGLQNLIVAFAELLASGKKATLTVTAFGKYREHYELMLQALSAGGRNLLDTVLSTDPYFEPAREYYAAQDDEYFRRIASAHPRSRVFFTGRLDHEEVVQLLPFMDLIVTPSVMPEAFGMVAIEGMACGVLSAVTDFSGLADVVAAAAGYLDESTMQLIRISPDDCVEDLRKKLPALVEKAHHMTSEDRQKLRRIVVDQFSWGKIAERFLEYVSSGDLPIANCPTGGPGFPSAN
jgi:glycosyltransferase involved in cell wall biosynthesis